MTAAAVLLLLLSLAGTGYTLHSARAVRLFGRLPRTALVAAEPVTLLKPLHGLEPRLAENLATFLDQDWQAPIQLVAGVQRRDDPALGIATGLGQAVTPVPDATSHGANGKVSNLVNMDAAAIHDLLVLSDSDMAVPRDYLAAIAAALAGPGVGAVTCCYRGRGDAGRWSVLAAAGISWQFMPAVMMGLAFGMAPPCMGSTIALRRATLDRIGGFARFADVLADDNAIGVAVRALGLRTAVAPVVLTHGCAERSLRALLRHELRWSATIRAISRWSHLGLAVTFPVGWALAALPFAPLPAGAALAVAFAARLVLVRAVDRLVGAPTAPLWMLGPRDLLSFAVWLGSFPAGSVEWRGARLELAPEGRIAARAGR